MALQDNRVNLGSRGIGFQAVGFAAVGGLSVALLYGFAGSDHWMYQAFELCVVKLYWAFVAPLAAIFDGVRKVFETRGELRRRMREEVELEFRDAKRAIRAEARAEALAEALEETLATQRAVRERMERAGLSRDVIEQIMSDEGGGQSANGQSANGGIDPQIKRYIDRRFEELGRD